MSIENQQDADNVGTLLPPTSLASWRRSNSRMLESYLGDIEYLIRERLWTEALPLALTLPHICAALENAALASSREQFLHWCELWVRPSQSDTSMTVPSPEELYRLASLRGKPLQPDAEPGVPMHALRQLRLRRLARAAPPRRRVSLADVRDFSDEPAREACVALLEAVRRWYDDYAVLDATVQNNFARLAVLR
jgi:hypothetical protein